MARAKPWVARIQQIIEHLERSEASHLSRVEMEQMFQIKRSAATELMNVVGTSSPGFVARRNLLVYLKTSQEGQDAIAELERRRRVAQAIQEGADQMKYRSIVLPVSRFDEWTQFRDLPDVSFEPGVMHVRFSTPLDLLTTLWRFIKAVGNEWQLFQKLCASETPPTQGGNAA